MKTKTKTFCGVFYRPTKKHFFFILGRKRKCRLKWNSIYGWKRNKNENWHSFSAEKRKRRSPDNISVFFIHSVTKSALQCAANTSSRFAFLQVVVDGIPLSLCSPTVYRYLCGIFLDDISTREQFVFLFYCYRVKAIFHNLCTVLYWRLCGLTNSPMAKYPYRLGRMCKERRRFCQTMASEWQTAVVVSHKMPWCALLTADKNFNKSLENCQDFFSVIETKTVKTMTKYSRPRLHDPRPRLSFLSSKRLETKTLVSRTASLPSSTRRRSAWVIDIDWLWLVVASFEFFDLQLPVQEQFLL